LRKKKRAAVKGNRGKRMSWEDALVLLLMRVDSHYERKGDHTSAVRTSIIPFAQGVQKHRHSFQKKGKELFYRPSEEGRKDRLIRETTLRREPKNVFQRIHLRQEITTP